MAVAAAIEEPCGRLGRLDRIDEDLAPRSALGGIRQVCVPVPWQARSGRWQHGSGHQCNQVRHQPTVADGTCDELCDQRIFDDGEKGEKLMTRSTPEYHDTVFNTVA